MKRSSRTSRGTATRSTPSPQYPAKGQTVPVGLTLVPVGPQPYKPLSVPGRIEAEDYDLGGEGVAYHDTTPGNAGGAYRADDVDIETAGGDHRTSAGSGTASG